MLLDAHAVLDHLYLDGTCPQATGPDGDYLRESASRYTFPGLIEALGEVISMLSRAEREAFRGTCPGTRRSPRIPHSPRPGVSG